MEKKLEIRNSTAEFLTFIIEGKEDGIEVMYADETIWCTQDAIISVGYRANSRRATQFRQWATFVLRQYV